MCLCLFFSCISFHDFEIHPRSLKGQKEKHDRSIGRDIEKRESRPWRACTLIIRDQIEKEENNNVMSRYDHKIETSLEGIEHLSKEENEKKERKMKEKNHYYNPLIL